MTIVLCPMGDGSAVVDKIVVVRANGYCGGRVGESTT